MSSNDFKEGDPVIVLEGIYKDKEGIVDVLANAEKSVGVKIGYILVWCRPDQIEKEGE